MYASPSSKLISNLAGVYLNEWASIAARQRGRADKAKSAVPSSPARRYLHRQPHTSCFHRGRAAVAPRHSCKLKRRLIKWRNYEFAVELAE